MMGAVRVLTEEEIAFLIALPKPIDDLEWRESLLNPAPGRVDARGRLDLDDLPSSSPIRGRLHLYSRRSLTPGVEGDWSVGLIYTDYSYNSFRVMRCNGPHPSDHVNRIEGDVIVRTPHIHRLTQRYQELRRSQPDGYAEPTDAYSDLAGALEELAARVNLEARGRLFL